MKFEQYSSFVGCDTDHLEPREADMLAGMGMGGEGGEVCDELKKVAFHGKEFDRDAMLKELGDVLWYMTLIMRRHDMTLRDVMERNVFKLCSRYPDRYGEPHNWLGAENPHTAEEDAT